MLNFAHLRHLMSYIVLSCMLFTLFLLGINLTLDDVNALFCYFENLTFGVIQSWLGRVTVMDFTRGHLWLNKLFRFPKKICKMLLLFF